VLLGADADFYFAGWNYGMKVGGEVTPETCRGRVIGGDGRIAEAAASASAQRDQ
jgi:hypothetical protein